MAVISKDLGAVTAYAAAVNRGYTGTKEEFETLMASYATVAQQAAESASNASQSAVNASQSATDAETAKGTAQQAATDAQAAQASAQESAQSAQQSAQSASQSAQDAESAKETAVSTVDEFDSHAQQALDSVNQAGVNWKSLAQIKALDSEAYALGTRDGEDVGSSDPAYHNNAKYYAEHGGASAQTATEAAQTATIKASEAQASASAAAESARTLTIDKTLTQSGQAADAKVVGDKIEGVKDELGDIRTPSKNLWTAGNQTFVTSKYVDLSLSAGQYTFSAIVSSTDTDGAMCQVAFYNDSTLISRGYVARGTARTSFVITLSSACNRALLVASNSTSGASGDTATFTDIQIESGNVATEYTPPYQAYDRKARSDAAEALHALSEIKNGEGLYPGIIDIKQLSFIRSQNLFDFNDPQNVAGYYIDGSGGLSANTNLCASNFIAVAPGQTYYLGGYNDNGDYTKARTAAEYDKDLNFLQFHNTPSTITTEANTKYIRFSYSSTATIYRVYLGTAEWSGINAPQYDPKIPSDFIENAGNDNHQRFFAKSSDTMASGDYLYDASFSNTIRNSERLVFNADVASFSSIEIGYAWTNISYKYNRFTIDGTKLTVTNYAGQTAEYTHGLTIANNIQVIIEQSFMRTCKVTIISNGNMFSQDGCALDRRRLCFPYVQSIGSTLVNAKFTWTCTDFNKPVWIFGDSYIASYTDRWSKYAYTYGYSQNVLWDAFPGEASADSIQSLMHLLTIAKPKIIVWCLGMNDGSDENDTTPSSAWMTAQTSLRELCASENIELVLATIPTVPTINHNAKDANVRSSGYRYIDFAKAVGASNSGVWYGDMLSSDGVHPADNGAKALFGRVLLDLPEIMVN